MFEQAKANWGTTAAWCWLGSGAYLFATVPNARFLSLQALVFFLPLTFVAAIVFGVIGYGAQRALAWSLAQPSVLRPSPRAAQIIICLGYLLQFGLAVLVFCSARYVVQAGFSGD